jgi:hypothetical protein
MRALRGVSQVFLRDATVLRSAGGLFSVALSVASPLERSPLVLPGALPCREFWQTNRLPRLRTVSGLSSRYCALRPSSQRLPGPPAVVIIPVLYDELFQIEVPELLRFAGMACVESNCIFVARVSSTVWFIAPPRSIEESTNSVSSVERSRPPVLGKVAV